MSYRSLAIVMWLLAACQLGWAGPLDVARQALERGSISEAQSIVQEHLALYPDDPEALVLRGRTVFEGARSQEFFDRVIALAPEHPAAAEALVNIAHYWFARGRYTPARSKAEQVLEDFPRSRWAHDARLISGRCLVATQQYSLAAETLSPLLRDGVLESVRRAAASSLSLAYRQMQQPAQAVRVLDDPAFHTDAYLVSLLSLAMQHADNQANVNDLSRQYRALVSQMEARSLDDVAIMPSQSATRSEQKLKRATPRHENLVGNVVGTSEERSIPAPSTQAVDRFIKPFAGFSVQVGTFSDRGNAVRLRRRLLGAGYEAVVVPARSGLNRVWVGNSDRREEIERLIPDLKALLKTTPFIISNR